MDPSQPLQCVQPAYELSGYKEDSTKSRMFRFEESLPKLPVPTLEETAKRYLKSVHPLLSSSEFESTKKAVESFVAPGGFGHKLQERLVARREDPKTSNWIYEWWNDAAYLGYRDPVTPYVSYFYSHRDDRKRRDPAKRAAAITSSVLEFKKQADEETLEPEYMKKLPIAMSSYEWMFNACRIPTKPSDTMAKYSWKENKHIIVVRKNQFFNVMHEVDGKQLSTKEFEQQFQRIYKMAEKAPAVGIMTSENRDTWTEVGLPTKHREEQKLIINRCARPSLRRTQPTRLPFKPSKLHRSSSVLTMPARSPEKSEHISTGTEMAPIASSTSLYISSSTKTAHQASLANTA